MNLSEFIKQDGKVTIITDSVSNTNKLLRKKVRENQFCIYAIQVVNIQHLAKELVHSYYATYEPDTVYKVIDHNVQSMRLHVMLKNENYKFLSEDAKDISTAEEILRIINEIRFGKETEEYRNCQDMKLNELKNIMDDYEAMLQKNCELDYCMLLKKAQDILGSMKSAKLLGYMIPELDGLEAGSLLFAEITELEKNFLSELERVRGKKIETLNFDPCKGQGRTNTFFKAYGVANEVGHIVDEMINQKMRYGDVAIMYPAEVYERALRGTLEARGIPYTFPKGFRAANTNIIQLMLDILDFAEGDFEYKKLKKVIHNPVLTIKGKGKSFERILSQGIGYGRERYVAFFENYKQEIEKNPEDRIATEEVRAFVGFLKEIIDCFDEKNHAATMYSALVKCVLKHTDTRDLYRNCMDERLKNYSSVIALENNEQVNDIIAEIRNYLVKLKCALSENGGSVTILPYGTTTVVDRANLFVLGLSNENIATTCAESPVLSDNELRTYVDGNVHLALDRNKRNREAFELSLQLTSACNLYFSYSYYDTVSLLDNSPALLYLEMLGDLELDKVTNVTYQVGSTPCRLQMVECIEPKETVEGSNDIAEEQMDTSADEVLKKKIVWGTRFSASSVQTLITCPLRYYYEKVKYIKSMEFVERNAYSWLNPAEKGNVFHHVMDDYVTQAIIKGNSTKLDEGLFASIFENEIERAIKDNPYPSEVIRDREQEEEREILKAYLDELYQELQTSAVRKKVIGCEVKFSDLKYVIEESTNTYILFEGSVDRMDGYIQNDTLYLQIYDYKTGKYKNKQKEIEENKQIQHHVYALAMLAWAKDNKAELVNYFGQDFSEIEIGEIAYIFPFEEANRMLYVNELHIDDNLGVRLPEVVNDTLRETVGEAIQGKDNQALTNAVKIALSNRAAESKACEYCNYKDICRI